MIRYNCQKHGWHEGETCPKCAPRTLQESFKLWARKVNARYGSAAREKPGAGTSQ